MQRQFEFQNEAKLHLSQLDVIHSIAKTQLEKVWDRFKAERCHFDFDLSLSRNVVNKTEEMVLH